MPSVVHCTSAVLAEMLIGRRLQDLADTAPVLILLPGLTGKHEIALILLMYTLGKPLPTL